MSLKLKALGLALVAALAMSAIAVFSASAETGGHFTSEVEHTILEGEDTGFGFAYSDPAAAIGFNCEQLKFLGTMVDDTAVEALLAPTFVNCKSAKAKSVKVNTNGCNFLLTIRKVEPDKKDNTVHLICPGASTLEVTLEGEFGNCLITIKAQTPAGGIAYKTDGAAGVGHDLRMSTTLSGIHAVYHGGIAKCGVQDHKTFETAAIAAETTLRGYNTEDVLVGITATGG